MKNTTLIKHYLHPNGISHSIIPLDRPTLSEWLAEYNTPIGSPQWYANLRAEITKNCTEALAKMKALNIKTI